MLSKLRNRQPFKLGSLYGKWLHADLYVVYSYGEHWPLACWFRPTHWSVNTDSNSRTTNRHAAAVRALLHGALVTEMNAASLKGLIAGLSRAPQQELFYA